VNGQLENEEKSLSKMRIITEKQQLFSKMEKEVKKNPFKKK